MRRRDSAEASQITKDNAALATVVVGEGFTATLDMLLVAFSIRCATSYERSLRQTSSRISQMEVTAHKCFRRFG